MLNKILAARRKELARERESVSLSELEGRCGEAPAVRSLAAAISQPTFGLIAEIKGASPSKGHIRSVADPAEIAKIYESAGAAAVSVLTEPIFFDGSLDYLRSVRNVVGVPILRKDFIFDGYQIYQARAYGADAILLMAGVVTDDHELKGLIDLAHSLGLEVLLESSDSGELGRALALGADVLGINNRNFYTLTLDLNVSLKLILDLRTDRPVISESGIFTREDVVSLENAGFSGILVGTALMESDDIDLKIKELMGR